MLGEQELGLSATSDLFQDEIELEPGGTSLGVSIDFTDTFPCFVRLIDSDGREHSAEVTDANVLRQLARMFDQAARLM